MEDIILIEKSIDIIVNSKPLVSIICLPKDLKELAVGFIYSVGLIDNFEDIEEIKVHEMEGKIYIKLREEKKHPNGEFEVEPIGRVIDTTCGIPSAWREKIKNVLIQAKNSPLKDSHLEIQANVIYESIKKLQVGTTLFRETGGCHGAGIFTLKGENLTIKEDIGRHNAIDKVIGDMIIKKKKLEDLFLTSTGRLTGDSVLKAIKANLPIFASIAAPIESGIRLAFAYGLTLIGFVRGKRMNIYTHPERILI